MRRILAALGLSVAFAPAGLGLDIVGYNSNVQDRFVPGTYAGAPTNNPGFWFSSLDWSGVGWQSNFPGRSVTMITPLHFLGAYHWVVNDSLSFLDGDGVVRTYGVSSSRTRLIDPVTGNTSDLYIGELTVPIPTNVAIMQYAIMDLPTYGEYVGLPLAVYGKVGTNALHASAAVVGTNTFEGYALALGQYLSYFSQTNVTGEAQGEGGDSGSPTFTLYGNTLALVGAHYSVGTVDGMPATVDTFVPQFIPQIQSVVEADGYSLMLIPEPTALMGLLAVCGAWIAWLRRRRG